MLVDFQPFDAVTVIFFQLFGGAADGVMFRFGGQNPNCAAALLRRQRRPAQGQIIRFGATGRENHLVRAAVQHRGDCFARSINRRLGLLEHLVTAVPLAHVVSQALALLYAHDRARYGLPKVSLK